MVESIWSRTAEIREREPLKENLSTQVAVIGGGMAGLLTAYYLQRAGKEVIVLEKDRIGGGQTSGTTAKITGQHGCIYAELTERYGEEFGKFYWRANKKAIEQYEMLIKEEGISCHFERVNSYLYTKKMYSENFSGKGLQNANSGEKLIRELNAAKKAGIKASFCEKTELPFSVGGGLCFEDQAQFHPLEFIGQLSDKLTVYESTRALKVKGHRIITDRGSVYAEHVVFASHYPFIIAPGFYFARQHQDRSYVLAVSGVKKWEGMYYGIDEEGEGSLSFRWFEDVLLIGGGGHRLGEASYKDGYTFLREQADRLFPGCKEVCCWSAQDCMPHDELYFIGRFSVFRPYWYVASGFKKWGMTGAMIAADIISDMICGEENIYEKLFTPQRLHFFSSHGKTAKDMGISIAGLAKGHFHLPILKKEYPQKGEGEIVRRGLKRYGVYRDEGGELHKTSVKCTHMGCELKWNVQEKTWDCPCHGSSFDCDGKLLADPAKRNCP